MTLSAPACKIDNTGGYGQIMRTRMPAGVDGKASDALLKLGQFFTRWEESDDGRVLSARGFGRAMSSTGIGGGTTRAVQGTHDD